ncbi:MAG: hypothetical protein JW810_14230 [Sedimentisphaerales bacterium]|nr:hypothetical protein [Sedimentisphaerales bacterium]
MRRAALLKIIVTVFAAAAGWTADAAADVRLPALVGDHMVLQRAPEVPVWGWADPGEKVLISTTWQKRLWSVQADGQGRWSVRLEAPERASGPFAITFKANNEITVQDVCFGEVWLCGGQANMEFPVGIPPQDSWKTGVVDSMREIATAEYPRIRLFRVETKSAAEPQSVCLGTWQACRPDTVVDFSAVGYFFGRHLHQALGQPIGLIQATAEHSPAEAWTPYDVLLTDADFKAYINGWERACMKYEEDKKAYPELLRQWRQRVKEAQAEKQYPPDEPKEPVAPPLSQRPAGLFNGMIAPVIPYGIRGAIWYQGESNVSQPDRYGKLFPALIQGWRQAWGQDSLAFYYVQLPNYLPANSAAGLVSNWAAIREAQRRALRLDETGMAVTIDIGEPMNLHPKNKQEVGRRLALWALGRTYDRPIVYSGPLYESMKIEDDRIRVLFRHTGGGLVSRDGNPLQGFVIAGSDRRFAPAEAQIRGTSVVVSSEKVPRPVAVRYAWADNPPGNLINREGLPAAGFRSDDWIGAIEMQP